MSKFKATQEFRNRIGRALLRHIVLEAGEDSLAVKSCFARGPRFNSGHPHGSPQPSVTIQSQRMQCSLLRGYPLLRRYSALRALYAHGMVCRQDAQLYNVKNSDHW